MQFDIDWQRASDLHVCAYATFLHYFRNFSASSIKSAFSGISHFYKMLMLTNPIRSPAIDKLLITYSREQQQDNRRPINRQVLRRLLLLHHPDLPCYYDDAFYLIYTLMYRMALRISEITNYSEKFHHALRYSDIVLHHGMASLQVTLRSYKHSTEKKIFQLQLSNTSIAVLTRFLQARGDTDGQLFIHRNGKLFSRSFIAKTLRDDLYKLGYNPMDYNTHSFRIGRTTDLAEAGCSELQIAQLGRWTSKAYHKYIRATHISA